MRDDAFAEEITNIHGRIEFLRRERDDQARRRAEAEAQAAALAAAVETFLGATHYPMTGDVPQGLRGAVYAFRQAEAGGFLPAGLSDE